jgi:hypothetical protein
MLGEKNIASLVQRGLIGGFLGRLGMTWCVGLGNSKTAKTNEGQAHQGNRSGCQGSLSTLSTPRPRKCIDEAHGAALGALHGQLSIQIVHPTSSCTCYADPHVPPTPSP